MTRRRLTAVSVLMVVAAATAVVLATGSTSTSSKSRHFSLARFNALHEGSEQSANQGDAAAAAAEDYSDRAYPADNVSIDQIQGATLHEVPGGHAPWLLDPQRAADLMATINAVSPRRPLVS